MVPKYLLDGRGSGFMGWGCESRPAAGAPGSKSRPSWSCVSFESPCTRQPWPLPLQFLSLIEFDFTLEFSPPQSGTTQPSPTEQTHPVLPSEVFSPLLPLTPQVFFPFFSTCQNIDLNGAAQSLLFHEAFPSDSSQHGLSPS